MDAATATLIATTASSLGLGILNYLREGRAHRWALEAREQDLADRARITNRLEDVHHEASTAASASASVDQRLQAIGDARQRGTEGDRRKDVQA